MEPLRVLLTIQTMAERAGGALYVADLARELLREGHSPVVFTSRVGDVAQELRSRGVPVVATLAGISKPPDLIHGNAPVETMAALLRFRHVPAVFTCHGAVSWDAKPPRHERIRRMVAVDEACRDRLLAEEGVPDDRISLIPNSVDLTTFIRRSPLPPAPKRALVFSNQATESGFVRLLREACAARDLPLDVMGEASGTASGKPAEILGSYDLVFAKGRAALEALAVGSAVILCDASGFGELVTSASLGALRAKNFGLRTLQNGFERETILRQILRYNPADAGLVTDTVRGESGLDSMTGLLLKLYREVLDEHESSHEASAEDDLDAGAAFLEEVAPLTNTFHHADLIRAAENRAATLRRGVDTLLVEFEMLPLEAGEMARIEVDPVGLPGPRRPGEQFFQDVQVSNGSGRLLASTEPNPVHLAYRWRTPEGAWLVEEGERSSLFPPLAPGKSERYRLSCAAPPERGQAALLVTLVQEKVAWLDNVAPHRAICVSVLIE